MVKDRVIHLGRSGRVACKGRNHDRWHPEAKQHSSGDLVSIDVIRRCDARGCHVLEKASPFIEVDDEAGLVPGRAARHSVEYRRQKGIAVADVRVRMIVIAGPVIQYRIDRVDKRDRRQRSGRGSSRNSANHPLEPMYFTPHIARKGTL